MDPQLVRRVWKVIEQLQESWQESLGRTAYYDIQMTDELLRTSMSKTRNQMTIVEVA